MASLLFSQEANYETVLRFDCKMSIQWEPKSRRFVYSDGWQMGFANKYYSAGTFEVRPRGDFSPVMTTTLFRSSG
jgi:hypothetical protein